MKFTEYGYFGRTQNVKDAPIDAPAVDANGRAVRIAATARAAERRDPAFSGWAREMIPLTPRQAELARFLVREHAEGRRPTFAAMAVALGARWPMSPYQLNSGIATRWGADWLQRTTPRGPAGERMRFIPVDALPGAPR